MAEDMAAALPLDSNKMRGLFDLPEDGLVSSLALTPDGCYVFAAFGGGEVRLYDHALRTVGAAKRNGTIVAHIKSKGMFSNTKVDCHVETSEDGRFVFAGLLRGSSEMLAFDITDLPRWGTLPTREEISLVSGRFDLNKRIRTYAHSDVKLKGFGAAATMRTGPGRREWGKEYRLFCGRGIKNIHIWSFKPEGPGKWTCIYDTNTNGATVELVAFRNGGLEGISKSNDANIRVWDLSNEDRPTKPRFQDISNSKDTRVVFGDFAYGGTTALSLVKLDAQAVANRMEIALPDAGVASPLAARGSPLAGRGSPLAGRMSPSARGKRHCRMLKDLAGTQDGRHVVLVCSDGMILYHRHTQAVNTMHLEPLEGLGFDEDDVRPTVALSLAGKVGLPVLMIARVRGRGDAAANDGDEGRQRKLELMVLPRSDAQQFEDSRVTRLDSLGRSLLPWPEGRRLIPEDKETDVDDDDAGDDAEGSGEEREKEAARRDPMCGRQGETAVTSAERMEANKPIAMRSSPAVAAPASPATPVALQTPQNRPASAAAATSTSTLTFGVHGFDSKPEASPFPPRSPMSPSLSPSVTSPHSRFLTPVPSERKRVRDDGGKTAAATAAAGPGSSPPARSPVGPSPGSSGSRGRRKKRGGASGSGHGRPPAGSSPAQDGVAGDAAAGSNVERRVVVAGTAGVRGGGVGQDAAGEKDAGSGEQRVQDSKGLIPSKDSVGANAEGVFAVGGKVDEDRVDDVQGEGGMGNGGGGGGCEAVNEDGEKDAAIAAGSALSEAIEIASEDHSRAADVEATSEDGTTAGMERRRKGSISGASIGRGASVGRRPGKKRIREDQEKGADDESGLEEGEHTIAAPMKRGRRGAGPAGEEGGHSSRWAGVKGRRTNLHNADDDSGVEQVLLRDRRSRLAARALRSSGNLIGTVAIAKGMIASWMTTEQPEELRVVRIAERDVEVDPPTIPGALVKFLTEREERREREDAPISLERARVQHNAGLKLLPHSLSTPTAAVEDEGDGEVGKEIETDKNERGFSPLLSLHHAAPSINLLAAEEGVFGSRDAAVVAPGLSFREEDGRTAAAAKVDWESHGEGRARTPLRATAADGTPSSDLFSFSGPTSGSLGRVDVAPKLDSSATAAASHEGSRISRQVGLRGVEDAFARSPPPVSEQSPAGSVASKTGVATDVIREAASVEEQRAVGPAAGVVAKNPFAAKDVDSQAEAGSNVDDSDKQAKAYIGENTAPIAGSDASAIGGENDSICDAAAAMDEHGDPSVYDAARRERNVPVPDFCGKVGPASSAEEGATAGYVHVGYADARTHTMDVGADGRTEPVAYAGKEKHYAPVSPTAGPPTAEPSSHMSAAVGAATSSAHKSSKRGAKPAAEAATGEATVVVASGPSVFPPPLESVIEMGRGGGEPGSGSEAIDRLYGEHCLEREAVARAFFNEQDVLRRRFLAAVDLVELDKAVECAGLELRNGCRAVQTLKSRLMMRWREATVLPSGAGGLSRCTGREAHQATLRWQEQIRVVISEFKDLLRDMLGRQALEAGALQISQEMDVPKGKAPKLEVRFAFPGIFDEVAKRHGIKL